MREIDVAHVVGGFVVLDEAAGPVVGLDHEVVAGLDPCRPSGCPDASGCGSVSFL